MSFKKICVEEDRPTFDNGDKDPKIVINSLDYDALAKIIMLLPIPERIDMEKICIKWKEACQLAWYDIKKYKCESSIGRSYDNRLLTQSYLEKILLRCGNYLNELSLSDVCDSSIMPFVGDHCKNLTSLECKFDVDSLIINADHFVQAFTQLDKLKCIKITVNYENSDNDKVVNLYGIIDSLPKEINEIHILEKSCLYIHKQEIFWTFRKFKNLQKLTLPGCNFLSSVIIQEISERTTLLYLDIELHNIPESFFFLFDKLVNLEYIKISIEESKNTYVNRKKLSTKVLNTIFCTCKNLKHLDMPPGLYDIAEIPRKKWINFQNLEYLGISCNIMPDLANAIVKYCKNLKHLRIHNHHLFMNTAIRKLTELENLESLLLLDTFRLHDESITAISNNCKKLKRLEIPYCNIVSSIDGEPLISPSVLDELSKLQCLKYLNLCYAKNLQDSTITAIANNCKNLESLKIQSSTGLTETALVGLTNLKNLQKLNVNRLDIITDSFLIKLKGLKELHCNGCKKLTNAGIIQFIKNNPDLEMIYVSDIKNITINIVIGADQATKNRTNGIILHIRIGDGSIIKASQSIITSQWLVVDTYRNKFIV